MIPPKFRSFAFDAPFSFQMQKKCIWFWIMRTKYPVALAASSIYEIPDCFFTLKVPLEAPFSPG
jgi:hypothetical protein